MAVWSESLCAFPNIRAVLQTELEESTQAMAADGEKKHSYLYHQGEFQHQTFTFWSANTAE